jgi:methionine synthase II (cobalamin-independent)
MEKMQKEWWYNLFFIQILLGIDSIRSGMFKRWDQFHDVLERIRDIYNQEVWVGPSMRVTQGYSIAEINEAILSHYSLCQ